MNGESRIAFLVLACAALLLWQQRRNAQAKSADAISEGTGSASKFKPSVATFFSGGAGLTREPNVCYPGPNGEKRCYPSPQPTK
jgi:hypothetical protein